MVRILCIRHKDNHTLSFLFGSSDIQKIVSNFLSLDEDFDEYRVIFPDLSERIWTSHSLK
jgi:hypothetical protein